MMIVAITGVYDDCNNEQVYMMIVPLTGVYDDCNNEHVYMMNKVHVLTLCFSKSHYLLTLCFSKSHYLANIFGTYLIQ